MTFEKPKTGCPKRNIKMIHFSSYINISRCHVVRSEAREIGRGRKRLSSTVKEWWKLFFFPLLGLFNSFPNMEAARFLLLPGDWIVWMPGLIWHSKLHVMMRYYESFFFTSMTFECQNILMYIFFKKKYYDKKIGHVEIAQFSIVSFFFFY